MVWATVLGFVFALTHPPMPEWAYFGIKMVGDALIPVMLFSLGVRLFEVRWDDWHIGVVGGIVCPVTGIAMALLLAPLLGLSDDAARAAGPVRLAAAGGAQLHGRRADRQEPAKVASIVLIGNVMSVIFVPIGPASLAPRAISRAWQLTAKIDVILFDLGGVLIELAGVDR